MAEDLDRVVDPEHHRKSQRIAKSRRLIALPIAAAAAIVVAPLPIPGSSAVVGYKTYQAVAGKGTKDVFEEEHWWRETIGSGKFKKAYKRLRGLGVTFTDTTKPEGRQKVQLTKYKHRRDSAALVQNLYFMQPDQEFIRSDRAPEYYYVNVMRALSYQEQYQRSLGLRRQ